MTVQTTSVRQTHPGDGGTLTFSYPWKIFDQTHLRVVIRDLAGTDTLKALTTNYTVTSVGDPLGGNVVFEAGQAPLATDTVIIEQILNGRQDTDFRGAGGFKAESHENALDIAHQLIQMLMNLLSPGDLSAARVPVLKIGDTVGAGGYDFLASQGKNLADPTEPQDAVTLASLGAGIIYDVLYPQFTWATRPDANATEYEIIRVRDPGGPMHWQTRNQKKDDTYEWITATQASPF